MNAFLYFVSNKRCRSPPVRSSFQIQLFLEMEDGTLTEREDKEDKKGGCKKSCVYGEIIFPDMNQICRNLLSNSVTSMLSKFLSDNSITSWFFFIHLF